MFWLVVLSVAVFDVARDPCRTFKEVVGFDVIRTLRLNNRDLWMVANPNDKQAVVALGPFGGRLRVSEKCLLTGVSESCFGNLDLHSIETALGNSIPPPLVGMAMGPLLLAWSMFTRLERIRQLSA